MAEQKFCKKCGNLLNENGKCDNCDDVINKVPYVSDKGKKNNTVKIIGISAAVIIIAVLAIKIFFVSDVKADELQGSWTGVVSYNTVNISIDSTGSASDDEQINSLTDELQAKQGTQDSNVTMSIDINNNGEGTLQINSLIGSEEYAVTYSNGTLKLDDKKKEGTVGEEYVIQVDGKFNIKRDEYKDLRLTGPLNIELSGVMDKNSSGKEINGKLTVKSTLEFKKNK